MSSGGDLNGVLKVAMACAAAFVVMLVSLVIAALFLAMSAEGCGETATAAGPTGYAYPLAEQGERGGGVADHQARAFGNWMSDNAVDILTPPNTPVVAVGDGVIYRQSGSSPCPSCNPAGWTLYLRSKGHNFAYMHLNSFNVHAGQHVKQGQVIGKSGTANSVDHLHFAAQGMNPELITDHAKAGDAVASVTASFTASPAASGDDAVILEMGEALLSRDYSVIAAAGIIGNAYRESRWDPGAVGTGGGGLFGFTTGEISLASLQAAADDAGVKWTDIDFQIGFMDDHMDANLKKRLNALDNVTDSTQLFMDEWERPGIPAFEDRLFGAKKALEILRTLGTTTGAQCDPAAGAAGPANLKKAVMLDAPQTHTNLPAKIGGVEIDTRIYDDAVWAANQYKLTYNQGYGTYPPSVSHSYGTALDIVPGPGGSWDTVEKFATDLGWIRSCGASGLAKRHGGTCPLVRSIRWIGYDGYPNHGRGNHLHVSWDCSCGAYDGSAHPPPDKVWVFPAPEARSSR